MAPNVNIQITADSVGPTVAGFGTGCIPTYTADWPERMRSFASLAEVTDDGFAEDSPEAVFATAYFGQTPKPSLLKIARFDLPPTQRYKISKKATPAAGYRYQIDVAGEGVTETEIDITLLADVAISAVTNGADSFTSVAHGMTTGDGPYRLTNAGGGLPTGSAVDTDYWIIVLTADTFSIAASRADALALTAVNLTSDGTGTHTLQRDANDVLMAQLVQALNDVVGKNFTATQTAGAGDTDTVLVTGDAAADWFSIEVKNRDLLTCEENNADPGTATDLAAVYDEDSDWRTFIPTFCSEDILEAAATWVEATPQRDMIASSSDSLIANTASTGSVDVADDLKTSGRKRTLLFYHPSPVKAMAAAFAGVWLTTTPGDATVKYQSPSGPGAVLPMTSTHRTNILAKNANYLMLDAGLTFAVEGESSHGQFFDIQRDDDYVETNMRARVLAKLVDIHKIPFTDAGIAVIVAEVRAALDDAVEKGIYASYEVEVPKASSVSAANRAARILPDIKWSAVRAGAVHTVDPVTGVVSV